MKEIAVFCSVVLGIISGFFFELFFIIGEKSTHLFLRNPVVYWFGIITGALFFYTLVYALVVKNYFFLKIIAIGVFIAQLYFSFLPITMVIPHSYFSNPNTNNYIQSIDKKGEGVSKSTSQLDCQLVKYGKFLCGEDTIIRYSKNGNDYELIVSEKRRDNRRIKWLNSCTYERIYTNVGLNHRITLQDFDSKYHYMVYGINQTKKYTIPLDE